MVFLGALSSPAVSRRLAGPPVALLVALLLGMTGRSARGAVEPDPDRPLPLETFRRFAAAGTVLAIAQDERGFLWLGTNRGLVRFDGANFVSAPAPLHHAVSALALHPDGTLLVAVSDATESGLFALRNRRTERLDGLSQQVGESVREIAIDRGGAVWLLSDRGVFRWDGAGATDQKARTARAFGAADGLGGEPPRMLTITGGDAWIAGPTGVFRWRQDRFERAAPDPDVTALDVDGDGRIWMATTAVDATLRVRTGDSVFVPREELRERLVGPFRKLRCARGGAHIATGNGFFWTDGLTVDRPVITGMPGYPAVQTFFVDRRGDTWIGTTFDGLIVLRAEPPVRVYNDAPGIMWSPPFSVLRHDDGSLWAAGARGLRHRRDGVWESHHVPDAISTFALRSLTMARDGGLWIAGMSALFHFKDGIFRRALELKNDSAQTVFRDQEGTVWVGLTRGGLLRERDGHFEPLADSARVCPAMPTSFAETTDGPNHTLWVGTDGAGLCAWDGQRLRRLTGNDGLPEQAIASLYTDAGGVLWIGGRQTLTTLEGGRFTRIPGVPDWSIDEVSSIIEDDAGHLWFSSMSGLVRIPRADLLAHRDGKGGQVRVLRLGLEDGLPAHSFFARFPPNAARTPDGSLWFTGPRGIVQVPHPARADGGDNLMVAIDEVLINGHANPPESRPALPAGDGNLEVHFAAAELDHPHRLRFAYRLDGLDRQWRDAGPAREARYTNLPPGDYTFRLAVWVDNRTERSVAATSFHLAAPFYRTRWFYAACGLMVLAAGLGVHRLRMLRIRDRYLAVTDERARIARDMHDTLEQSLIGMKLQLETLSDHRDDPEAVQRNVHRAQELVGQTIAEAKSSIWALRTEISQDVDLITRLSVASGRALRRTEVRLNLESTGTAFRLQPETEQQVVRIVQAGITNALKHAAPRTITLTVRFETDLHLILRDDGQGFDAEDSDGPATGHFGLLGMRERAAALGGTIEVKSAPGEGTVLHMVIPGRHRRGKRVK